ncbi:protein kinase [Candidatus Woesearchaeota archaeon]|nr:protein kinase [Candidatus Woesearchaeota archaeon]
MNVGQTGQTLDAIIKDEPQLVLKNNIARAWKHAIAKGGFGTLLLARFDNVFAFGAELINQGEADPAILGLEGIPYSPRPENGQGWLPTPIEDPQVRKRVIKAGQDSWTAYQNARAQKAPDQGPTIDRGDVIMQYCDFLRQMDIELTQSPLLAVKVLIPPTGKNADEERVFRSEVERKFIDEYFMLRRLKHPNIVRTHGLIEDPKYGWTLYMDYIDGLTLEDYIISQEDKRLPAPVALKIVERVADAVKYCHANGIIHRDIKPANVLIKIDGVEADGTPKLIPYLCDFGISKNVDSSQTTIINLGSPHHVSPEQACGNPVTFASDVYQLGSLLFEMVTGKGAYEGLSIDATLTLLRNPTIDHPTVVRDYLPNLSERVKDLIEVARRKDPEKRWIMDKFISEARYIIEKGLYDETPRRSPTRTELIELWKVVDLRRAELETKIQFIRFEEDIDKAKELYKAGDFIEFEMKVTSFAAQLAERPQRYTKLKEELTRLLLEVADNRLKAKEYTQVGTALTYVTKCIDGLKNVDTKVYGEECQKLSVQFGPHSLFVSNFSNVADSLKSVEKGIKDVYTLRTMNKPFSDKLSSLELQLTGVRGVWTNTPRESIGSAYERMGQQITDIEDALTDLKRETRIDRSSGQ